MLKNIFLQKGCGSVILWYSIKYTGKNIKQSNGTKILQYSYRCTLTLEIIACSPVIDCSYLFRISLFIKTLKIKVHIII